MNNNNVWYRRLGHRPGRCLFWGMTLVALGSLWLLGNLEVVPEPATIVLPGLVILWGIAAIFTRRSNP